MPHIKAYLAVKGAALLEVNGHELLVIPFGNRNLPGIQLVVRAKGLLYFTELRIEIPEILPDRRTSW